MFISSSSQINNKANKRTLISEKLSQTTQVKTHHQELATDHFSNPQAAEVSNILQHNENTITLNQSQAGNVQALLGKTVFVHRSPQRQPSYPTQVPSFPTQRTDKSSSRSSVVGAHDLVAEHAHWQTVHAIIFVCNFTR